MKNECSCQQEAEVGSVLDPGNLGSLDLCSASPALVTLVWWGKTDLTFLAHCIHCYI